MHSGVLSLYLSSLREDGFIFIDSIIRFMLSVSRKIGESFLYLFGISMKVTLVLFFIFILILINVAGLAEDDLILITCPVLVKGNKFS